MIIQSHVFSKLSLGFSIILHYLRFLSFKKNAARKDDPYSLTMTCIRCEVYFIDNIIYLNVGTKKKWVYGRQRNVPDEASAVHQTTFLIEWERMPPILHEMFPSPNWSLYFGVHEKLHLQNMYWCGRSQKKKKGLAWMMWENRTKETKMCITVLPTANKQTKCKPPSFDLATVELLARPPVNKTTGKMPFCGFYRAKCWK